MQEARLENLIRQLAEIDDLFGSGRTDPLQRRAPHRIEWLAPAAAILLALCFWIPPRRPVPTDLTPVVSIDYEPDPTPDRPPRIDRLHACADVEAYALILLRTWSHECECLTWRLHRTPEGHLLIRLRPGRGLEVPVDVSDAPPIEQVLILAVAREASRLPDSPEQLARLLTCLEQNLSPMPEDADTQQAVSLVQACLPAGVTVVPRSFGGP